VLVEFALGVSVAQAAGARELLEEALRGRCEVGWRPNEQGVTVDSIDDNLHNIQLTPQKLSARRKIFFFFGGLRILNTHSSSTLQNILLTPQKLSAWRKNHPGAPGAGV